MEGFHFNEKYLSQIPALQLLVNLGYVYLTPTIEVTQAVSQMIRNQRDEFIPTLFTYAQILVSTNKNEVRYATTGTPAKFWAVWKEDVWRRGAAAV